MRTSIACLLAVTALGGCFYQNMSPATKLRDAVEANNEGARWGRMDIARERVAAAYARDFALRRYDWGHGIQMADVDILSIQMDEENKHANVMVAYGWYSYDDMSLERTVIRQEWESSTAGGFVLMDETVVDGDERLLEPPPEPEEDEAEEVEDDEEVADRGRRSGDAERDADAETADDVDEDAWIEADDEQVAEPGTLASAT